MSTVCEELLCCAICDTTTVLATAAGSFSVCFQTVRILVKIEQQNDKNIYLKDVFTARTVSCTFDYIYRLLCVAPCVYIRVITVSLSRAQAAVLCLLLTLKAVLAV